MTDDRWPRVKRLFEAAVEQPPAERSAFLAAASAGDDALRHEVEELLAADAADDGFSERWAVTPESWHDVLPASATAMRQADLSHDGLAPGSRLGKYRFSRRLVAAEWATCIALATCGSTVRSR